MLCTSGRRFSTPRWLITPVLFVAAVVGVTGLPMVLLHAPVRLYAGIFGAAAALAAVTSSGAVWRRPGLRIWLRWPYIAAVAGLGLLLDTVTIPAYLAVAVGVPAAGTLLLLLARGSRRCDLEPDPTALR